MSSWPRPYPGDDPDTEYGIARPGRFVATWATPAPGGSVNAFSGAWSLELERDEHGVVTGYWLATCSEGPALVSEQPCIFTGRSRVAAGAFIAMLADRVGLVAEVDFKPDPGLAAVSPALDEACEAPASREAEAA